MTGTRRRIVVLEVLASAVLLVSLSACAPQGDSSGDGSGDSGSGDSSGMITLAGTGSYTVGDQAPYGGYELKDSVEQPAGCTWSIQDEDGVAVFENQGNLVFLTDIPEAVNFVTDGCPDWVQFE